ncbi:hypothetical protein WJX77_011116 [Trebouxia sp. C0004]
MEIQRSEGIFCEIFELDMSQITKLAHTTVSDFQPSQGNQPARKKPTWIKSTHAPEIATQPTCNSGGFGAYRFKSDGKGTEGGEGTPHLPTRAPAGFASQSAGVRGQQQQQHAGHGEALKTLNGQHGTSSAEGNEWRQAQLAANGRAQMTPRQHHSGAEKPSTLAVNNAGLQQQELTGSAALQKRQFAAASCTQRDIGDEKGFENRVLQSLCYLTGAVMDLKDEVHAGPLMLNH